MPPTGSPTRPRAASDWECFLLPAPMLRGLSRLPMHETCRAQLEHVVVPAALRTGESVRRELGRRNVCAVSWRWSGAMPAPATPERLKDWSPMSDLQLRRLKELAAQSGADHLWVDWACVPQVSGDTMQFINASYDIYSQARRVVFLPRIKVLARRGWPRLSPESARAALALVRASAEGVLSAGSFSEGFNRIFKDSGRVNLLEERLRAARGRGAEVGRQVESSLGALSGLLAGEEVVYPTFDYYARAWTLAERLAAFRPTGGAPIRLGEMQSAGDALLYTMSSFWRDAREHAGANARGGRPSWDVSDMSMAVYMRAVDTSDAETYERWDDMNRMVQLAPGTVGVGSETAALAVICVEWLLHESAGASDDLGRFAASLLGECVAYISLAVAGSTMTELADPKWFRKYMYFQAGSVYGSTVARDLILAVYRSCGLPERETADEAVESCLREVFGDPAESATGGGRPAVEALCREALGHEELHAHMPSAGEGGRALSASDFAPVMPPARAPAPVSVAAWHEWLAGSGVIVSWGFSNLDATMPSGPTEYIDVEHLYCGGVEGLTGLSLEGVFRSAVTVVYRLQRFDEQTWRLVHMSLSRRGGRCGEGLNPYRNLNGLTLERLLGRDILSGGRARAELIADWNGRVVRSLDQAVHDYWLQCVSSPDIVVVS
jgi:hypothetical protein